MRLKLLTPSITLLMLIVCLVLGATLWWSQRALERPQQLMGQYLALSQQLQRLTGEIGSYLDGGDALRHRAVLEALAHFDSQLADLPAVHSPRRAGLDEGDKLGRARAALNKNPNSTEALAALFAAM